MHYKNYAIVALLAGGAALTQASCSVFKNHPKTPYQLQTENAGKLDVTINRPLRTDPTSKVRDDLRKQIIAALKTHDLVVTLTENGSPEAIQTFQNLGKVAGECADSLKKKILVICTRSENHPGLTGNANSYEVGFYDKNSAGKKGILDGMTFNGDHKGPDAVFKQEVFRHLIQTHLNARVVLPLPKAGL
jgi:hypothetical protein